VLSNLDGLVAFHTSAEDAEYLAEELGGGLNKQDLLELGYYECYARITDVRKGERLAAFSVRLKAPPVSDPAVADRLAAGSAERYGRNVVDVELDLEAAAAHIRHSSATPADWAGESGGAFGKVEIAQQAHLLRGGLWPVHMYRAPPVATRHGSQVRGHRVRTACPSLIFGSKAAKSSRSLPRELGTECARPAGAPA
jgi:hypothetical protein